MDKYKIEIGINGKENSALNGGPINQTKLLERMNRLFKQTSIKKRQLHTRSDILILACLRKLESILKPLWK